MPSSWQMWGDESEDEGAKDKRPLYILTSGVDQVTLALVIILFGLLLQPLPTLESVCLLLLLP